MKRGCCVSKILVCLVAHGKQGGREGENVSERVDGVRVGCNRCSRGSRKKGVA